MNIFSYPYRVEPAEEGGYLVQFLDLDEAFSEGDTMEEAHANAAEVLDLILKGRIDDGFDLIKPGVAKGSDIFYATPAANIQIILQIHWLC